MSYIFTGEESVKSTCPLHSHQKYPYSIKHDILFTMALVLTFRIGILSLTLLCYANADFYLNKKYQLQQFDQSF